MLNFYNTLPLDGSSLVYPADFFVGDGTTTVFTLTQKLGSQVGPFIQVGNSFYNEDLGQFSVSGNNVIFAVPPGLGDIVTVPATTTLLYTAFDQPTVPGLSTPTVYQASFYVADPVDIASYSYFAAPGNGGIVVSLDNHDPSFGPIPSWYQFAQATGGVGGPGTWGTAGASITIPPIQGFCDLSIGSSAFATTITVADGTQFSVGSILVLDIGNGNEDFCGVTNITGNVLTVTSLNNSHSANIPIYECGRKLWALLTVPNNANSNDPISFFNLTFDITGIAVTKF